jgi:hypothetical protein
MNSGEVNIDNKIPAIFSTINPAFQEIIDDYRFDIDKISAAENLIYERKEKSLELQLMFLAAVDLENIYQSNTKINQMQLPGKSEILECLDALNIFRGYGVNYRNYKNFVSNPRVMNIATAAAVDTIIEFSDIVYNLVQLNLYHSKPQGIAIISRYLTSDRLIHVVDFELFLKVAVEKYSMRYFDKQNYEIVLKSSNKNKNTENLNLRSKIIENMGTGAIFRLLDYNLEGALSKIRDFVEKEAIILDIANDNEGNSLIIPEMFINSQLRDKEKL